MAVARLDLCSLLDDCFHKPSPTVCYKAGFIGWPDAVYAANL